MDHAGLHPRSLVDLLPPHLAERCRTVGEMPLRGGSFVLHWTHHALRGDENPALEVAATLARSLGVGLVVHAGLGGRHPYASDRHSTFILEGLRDLAADLDRLGIPFSCSPGDRGRFAALVAESCLVVTEDFPVAPFPAWTEAIGHRRGRPAIAVDTACVVPMNCSKRSFDRAFAYRDATEKERRRRVPLAWPACLALAGEWPRVPLADDARRIAGLSDADLSVMVGSLELDRSVGPVPETRGGSRAGIIRWNEFRDGRLARYERDRNDAADSGPGGATSRLSAYLHYGMVSPLRIAREAHAAGATKFLDELLVWRELAYLWCRHEPRPERLAALPGWARRTLEEHARDPRPFAPSFATLSRGTTGERLWDLAQASLVRHGELHNNVRMTWGKAIVEWAPSPEDALRWLVELNHRYALDGCDPSSYGGLLWCLGLFDRPFEPERPVIGSLRPRPVEGHAARMDLARYARVVDRRERPGRVAVIGAGFAGLTLARTLHDHGMEVTVLEKSRGTAGRAAARRDGERTLPLGADHVAPRTAEFRRWIAGFAEDGLVSKVRRTSVTLRADACIDADPAIDAFVGNPTLGAVTRRLAEGLDVRFSTRVTAIGRDGSAGFRLETEGDSPGRFDLVLIAIPRPQAAELVAPLDPEFVPPVDMRPCLVVATEAPGGPAVDEIRFAADPVLSRARRAGTAWIVEANAVWSATNLERSPEEWGSELAAAFAHRLGQSPAVVLHAHRWRYAFAVPTASPRRPYRLEDLGLGLAGDWLAGASDIEAAWRSGLELAGHVLRLPVPVIERVPATLFG
jgi:photolyase PhrII